ncbi:putative kif21a protein [Paratrimastix pyriformis]|uniref:Kinesin-like protein n=1 Tax=Paratrimastix pyriformis TaxID=342808 RepID=A0ABQ8U1R8_9EUKA|nr:putative kif21a protein [Paratrimastix pyriformis]
MTTAVPGRVAVHVRIRPPFKEEADSPNYQCVVRGLSRADVQKVSLLLSPDCNREFHFDHVFPPESTQETIYRTTAFSIVQDVMRGVNGTLLAYGQTGTGKTYTMGILDGVKMGGKNTGIIPTSMQHIFEYTSSHPEIQWHIKMSFLQIYMENYGGGTIHHLQDLLNPASCTRLGVPSTTLNPTTWHSHPSTQPLLVIYTCLHHPGYHPPSSQIQDLLNPDPTIESLPLRESPDQGFFVDGLREIEVRTPDEAYEVINTALQNRCMAPTYMNITSSRSHTVLTVTVTQQQEHRASFGMGHGPPGAAPPGPAPEVTYHKSITSKLILVDLAGSERIKKTSSEGPFE